MLLYKKISDNNNEASVKGRLGVKGLKGQGLLVGQVKCDKIDLFYGHSFQHRCRDLYDIPCGLHMDSDKRHF